MKYDALGRRVLKQIGDDCSTTKEMGDWDCKYRHYYDGDRLIEERNGSGTILNQFVWGEQYIDELVQIVKDADAQGQYSTAFFAVLDANHNVVEVHSGSSGYWGPAEEAYEYTPYGERAVFKDREDTGPYWPPARSRTLTSGICDVGMQGLFIDKEWGGKYFVRHRYWDPVLMCWMSADPLGYPDGNSRFEGWRSNPLGGFDPTGQWVEWLWKGPAVVVEAAVRGVAWTGRQAWRGAVRTDQFAGQVGTYVLTGGDWVDKTTASGLSMSLQTGMGGVQGGLNLLNGVQDVAIDVVNIVPWTYNNTAGWLLPDCPYIPSPEWSRNLAAYESESCHRWSKGLQGGGVATLTGLGIARYVQLPRYAVPVLRIGGGALVARNTYRSGEMIGEGTVDIENGDYWSGGGKILFGGALAGLNAYSGVQIVRSYLPVPYPSGGAQGALDTIAEGRRLSIARLTQPGETFLRYETGNPAFSRVTSGGGLSPGTFVAPSSEGLLPQSLLNGRYNLPSPGIPRVVVFEVGPSPNTWIIGPKPVMGGTGYEAIFPYGTGGGTVGPGLPVPPR